MNDSATVTIEVEEWLDRGAREVAFVAKGHRPDRVGFVQREGEGDEVLARASRGLGGHLVGPWRLNHPQEEGDPSHVLQRFPVVPREGTARELGQALAKALEGELSASGRRVAVAFDCDDDTYTSVATAEEMNAKRKALCAALCVLTAAFALPVAAVEPGGEGQAGLSESEADRLQRELQRESWSARYGRTCPNDGLLEALAEAECRSARKKLEHGYGWRLAMNGRFGVETIEGYKGVTLEQAKAVVLVNEDWGGKVRLCPASILEYERVERLGCSFERPKAFTVYRDERYCWKAADYLNAKLPFLFECIAYDARGEWE